MDGFRVEAGDHVHDILLGGGVVKMADATQIMVDFGGRTMTYSPDGHFGSKRRLYWSDPILEPPPKHDRRATLIRALIRAARSHAE